MRALFLGVAAAMLPVSVMAAPLCPKAALAYLVAGLSAACLARW